jgi:hypothetical protein
VVADGVTGVDPDAGAPLIAPGVGSIDTDVGLLVMIQDKTDCVCPDGIGFGLAVKLVITGAGEPTVTTVEADTT